MRPRYECRKSFRLALPGCYPLWFELSWAHFYRGGTQHGPQSNPWLITARLYDLKITAPSAGRRLWVYVRGGYSFYVEAVIDRRPLPVKVA